ncbi:hypothetical protein OH76DRAFT_304400 [Lentinus brumalis]|uniref:Glucose-methanol-choline oxidoreductase N-terminal domain-containing protein n=1 Tax=Lentinus brumalis TaxID=2498619 RepID=A0A371DGG5_9APHY|nr:hypothetical protein OH76DRAFT_304400 [Polyporus brumalis]
MIKVRKEVIPSSGAMGSPRVLMHSGIGPADVLPEAADGDVQVSLPGVGQHLQDHLVRVMSSFLRSMLMPAAELRSALPDKHRHCRVLVRLERDRKHPNLLVLR